MNQILDQTLQYFPKVLCNIIVNYISFKKWQFRGQDSIGINTISSSSLYDHLPMNKNILLFYSKYTVGECDDKLQLRIEFNYHTSVPFWWCVGCYDCTRNVYHLMDEQLSTKAFYDINRTAIQFEFQLVYRPFILHDVRNCLLNIKFNHQYKFVQLQINNDNEYAIYFPPSWFVDDNTKKTNFFNDCNLVVGCWSPGFYCSIVDNDLYQ